MDILDRSMTAYIRELRSATGNRDVISFYGNRISRDKLYADVDAVAAYLHGKGIGRGANVVVCLPNIPDSVVVFYALNELGAVANILHPLTPSGGLKKFAQDSDFIILFDEFYHGHKQALDELGKPVMLCSARDYLDAVKSAGYALLSHKRVKGIEYGRDLVKFATAVKCEDKPPEDIGRGEDIAVYLHSGGTTGEPKTVMLSNYAINALADKSRSLIGGCAEENDSMLMVLPLFHGFGLATCMHTVLAASGRIVMMPSFNARSACKLVKKEKITFIAGVPNMYAKMMGQRSFYGKHLGNLKNCYCGGDKLPDGLQRDFDAAVAKYGGKLRLNEGYGLTEVVTVCCVNRNDDYRPHSLGKPLEGILMEIADDAGNILPYGEIGELIVCSETAMSGYLGDAELTSRVMFRGADGKLWIRTGDMGYKDADGFLYFKDREKRMAKISGINVFPAEIERVAAEVRGVKRACAVKRKDGDGKTYIKLFLTAEKEVDGDALKAEVRKTVEERLLKYSVPREIEIRESLPLTEIGKVDFKALEREG